jgi:two-component system repressor protein LuxO
MSRATKFRILIVEDVPALAESYAAYLRNLNVDTEIAGDGAAAYAAMAAEPPDVVVLDVNLPDVNGIEILQRIRASGARTDVIVVTGEGSVNLAVQAMRHGAFDFLVKPFSIDRLRSAVRSALERREAGEQKPVAEPAAGDRFVGFIGKSPVMDSVYRILRSAAPSNATVFVTGESGTGKELCAEALHKLSKRRDRPFVVINCAAIPRDLLESEIFGHVKGAFTGATADRKGAALQADGGTLFLDEICEMDLSLQAKMLRFLQDRQVRRLGEDTPRPTDVRIVCATNRDPQAEVAAGRFREDLFYRLHVVPVELPPLRERGEDILLIASHFLTRYAAEDGKALRAFSSDAKAALLACAWPGNVRQLQNVIRSAVVLNDGEVVTAQMLPVEQGAPAPASQLVVTPTPSESLFAREAAARTTHFSQPQQGVSAPETREIKPLEVVIRETIENAIERCGGSVPRAAAALTVSPSTLYRRLQAWQDAAQNASGH